MHKVLQKISKKLSNVLLLVRIVDYRNQQNLGLFRRPGSRSGNRESNQANTTTPLSLPRKIDFDDEETTKSKKTINNKLG